LEYGFEFVKNLTQQCHWHSSVIDTAVRKKCACAVLCRCPQKERCSVSLVQNIWQSWLHCRAIDTAVICTPVSWHCCCMHTSIIDTAKGFNLCIRCLGELFDEKNQRTKISCLGTFNKLPSRIIKFTQFYSRELISLDFCCKDSNWVELSWIVSNWVKLGQIESNWVKLSQIESNWVKLSQIESYAVKCRQMQANAIKCSQMPVCLSKNNKVQTGLHKKCTKNIYTP
jgi:hypothetical protein